MSNNLEQLYDDCKPKQEPVLLIDADIIKYRIGYAADSQEWTIEKARQEVDSYLYYIFQNCESTKYIGFFTGSNNFRKTITLKDQAEYKGNRKDKILPKYLYRLHNYMINMYRIDVTEYIEADDAISICAQQFRKDNVDYIIVSTDKDLDQIPGYHYNPVKQLHYSISQEQADDFLLKQMVTGDTADNVKGLPKAGEKAFDKFRHDFLANSTNTFLEAYLLDRYIEKLGIVKGIESFYYNYRMLRLLTEPEYGFVIPEINEFDRGLYSEEDIKKDESTEI